MVIYGIAADGYSNMKNWINVQKEGVESIEKIDFIGKTNDNKTLNNFNVDNYNNIYKISGVDKIKIKMSDSNILVNIEIIEINQNLQRFLSGMTANAFGN